MEYACAKGIIILSQSNLHTKKIDKTCLFNQNRHLCFLNQILLGLYLQMYVFKISILFIFILFSFNQMYCKGSQNRKNHCCRWRIVNLLWKLDTIGLLSNRHTHTHTQYFTFENIEHIHHHRSLIKIDVCQLFCTIKFQQLY